jgi:hypothetical protein
MAADDPRKVKKKRKGRPRDERVQHVIECADWKWNSMFGIGHQAPFCLPGKLLALPSQITAEARCTVPEQIIWEDADEIPASL